MEAMERVCQLTLLPPPQLTDSTQNDAELITFFHKLAEALTAHFSKYESMEKTVSDSRLRQVNLGIIHTLQSTLLIC